MNQFNEHHVGSVETSRNILSIEDIRTAASQDNEYQRLVKTIKRGFEDTRSLTDPNLRQYFSVKDRLSLLDHDVVVLDDRIVIPKSLRGLFSSHFIVLIKGSVA